MNVIIPKEEYKSKHKFFKKWEIDLYLQKLYNYIIITENKRFFTYLQDKEEKEKYLDLENMELRNAISKRRLSFI